jgi:hypothetical protein
MIHLINPRRERKRNTNAHNRSVTNKHLKGGSNMGRVPTDLTKANLIDAGDYIGNVSKLNYQVKTGDKWNQEGTSTVTCEEWTAAPPVGDNGKSIRRLQFVIGIPGKGNHFNDLYTDGFIQQFMKATDTPYDKDGYDPDEAVGKQVAVEVGIVDDPEYGMQNTFKYSQV